MHTTAQIQHAKIITQPNTRPSKFPPYNDRVFCTIEVNGHQDSVYADYGNGLEQCVIGDTIAVKYTGQKFQYIRTSTSPQVVHADPANPTRPQRTAAPPPRPNFRTANREILEEERAEHEPKKDRKKEVQAYMKSFTALYLNTYNEVARSEICANLGMSDEQVGKAATTIFIQTCRSLNL